MKIHGFQFAVRRFAKRFDRAAAEMLEAALRRAADRIRWQQEGRFCTGIAASWCPIHGDCRCRPSCPDCGSYERIRWVSGVKQQSSSEITWRCDSCEDYFITTAGIDWPRDCHDCPLHSERSTHGEQP